MKTNTDCYDCKMFHNGCNGATPEQAEKGLNCFNENDEVPQRKLPRRSFDEKTEFADSFARHR